MRWYNLALRLTADSTHPKFKMAAVIVRGGSVISSASNGPNIGQHAECRAVRHPNVDGATAYIARAGGRMSKPCKQCEAALYEAGVTRVVYADWNGSLVTANVCVDS